ncbi:MAG TPA: acyltransferase [Polyangiaceae bacterium]|jgi:hypothetical protein
MKHASRRSARTLVLSLTLGLSVPMALIQTSCKEDEPPPPLPSAAPVATPAPTVELVPELDAGLADAGDAGPKVTGTGRPASSMMACCNALESNAQLAPEPNRSYFLQAAGVCKSMAGAGQSGGPVFAAIRGALQGAGMPVACK